MPVNVTKSTIIKVSSALQKFNLQHVSAPVTAAAPDVSVSPA
jgi:hypothetical protein